MKIKRNIYLKTVPIPEALALVQAGLDREALVGVETVPVPQALGRVTVAPILARYSSPASHCAAMDGIAVKAEDTHQAREGRPARLAPNMGFCPVNTGDILPPGMDAVVMIEHVVLTEDGSVLLEAPVAPWSHVRRIGEDIVATEMILPRHRQLSAHDLGALLSCGVWEVEVFERVRLTLIPTGDEVLDHTMRPVPGPGQVVESNSVMIQALAGQWGFTAERTAPVKDRLDHLSQALEQALASPAHIVALLAGSSAGSKDLTRAVMERFGQVLVHGIAAMPGKPSILGLAKGKLMVGVPGYPVSAAVCFDELIGPLGAWLGRGEPLRRPEVAARMAREAPSRPGMTELLRLAVGRVGDGYSAVPLSRGAGLITSLTKAQGLTRIPTDREGLASGEVVRAELLVSAQDLDRTILVVGSHDLTLDLLGDELMRLDPPLRLGASHVGSMGGVRALALGAALASGAHLFDPSTGDFNFPFLAKLISTVQVRLVNVAIRRQGLMVAPGNPRDIQGIASLTRPDVRFVNRQRGSGTRILLDHHLRLGGIEARAVHGYTQEEMTHMGVAANVASGAADCGLGIYSAAKALGLDFVPLARERYDLIIPLVHLEDPRVRAMLEVLPSPAFKAKVRAMGGYETAWTGQTMSPGMGLPEE